MKNKRMITGILVSLVLVVTAACNAFGGGENNAQKTIDVVRGDLAITVSGSGNIEVSNDADLVFGIGGRIESLLVEAGDEVSHGEVIAVLETDDLELALTRAEVAYAQAEVAVTEAEVGVVQAEAAIATARLALQNAEISLEQTIRTSTLSDIRIAKAAVDAAKDDLDDALFTLAKYDEGTPGYAEYQKRVVQAQARYQTAKDTYDAMLTGFGTKDVQAKQQQVDAAQQSLDAAEQSLDLAKLAPSLSKESLGLAEQSLENARKQLQKATLIAPFDGAVSGVFVDAGDTVLPTTMIAHLIEPGRMKLKVQVDEIDIPEVKMGQRAIIEVDALPETTIEGKVGLIGLLPTIEAGVIVYEVTIDFDATEAIGLRAGMSATADIVTRETKNALLVPDPAVRRDSQGNTVVDVLVNGETQTRTVVTGISDGFQTEIVSGLQEGDMVIEQ